MRYDPFADPKKPPRQKQILAFQKLDENQDLLVILPTSYGKTNIALYMAQKSRDHKKKFLLGVPLKALVEEHYQTFRTFFPNVVKISGDYRENRELVSNSEADGYIMTYEMIYQLFLKDETRHQLFDSLDSIIIDEAHLIGMESRGAVIESLLYILEQNYPRIHILLLSATVGNPSAMAEHFDLEKVYASEKERPIPLKKEVLVIDGINYKQDRIGLIKSHILDILKPFSPESSPNILVFCQSREETEKLTQDFKFSCPKIAVDYHHAGRKREDKSRVENDFRQGKIKILFSTPTLAMGINVPCDIVIISSVRRWNPLTSSSEIIPSSELIQMMGRAGRPGQMSHLDYGQAYIFCSNTDYAEINRIIKKPVEVTSQIPSRKEYIFITWIKAGIQSEKELHDWYLGIFSSETTEKTYITSMGWLCKNNFLEKKGDEYSLLPDGLLVTKYAIEPQTVVYLRQLLVSLINISVENLSVPTLFGLILGNDEFCGNIQINIKLDEMVLKNAHFFMKNSFALAFFEKIKRTENWEKIQKAFALIYGSFIKKRYLENEEFLESLYPMRTEGEFLTILDEARRIILATKEMFSSEPRFHQKLDLLWKGLDCTIPVFDENMIRLLYIPELDVKQALLLYKVGIKNFNDLLKADTKQILEKIPPILQKFPDYTYIASEITTKFIEHLQSSSISVLNQFRGQIIKHTKFSEEIPNHVPKQLSSSKKTQTIVDGYCILCRTPIDFDIFHPICPKCKNQGLSKKNITGSYCHKCGRQNDQITLRKPFDVGCWMKENI